MHLRVLAIALLAFSAACRRAPSRPPVEPGRSNAHPDAAAAVAVPSTAAVVDAGPTFTPATQVVALGTWVPIRATPRRDGQLVGYMRAGGIVAVDGRPVGRETCPVHRDHPEGGWYHVTAGGYVCVGGALAVPWPAHGERRPAQPDMDAGMPYQYAIVYGSANLYRAPPSREELHVVEPWRYPQDAGIAPGTAAESNGSDPAETVTASATSVETQAVDPPAHTDPAPQGSGRSHTHDHHGTTNSNTHDRHGASASSNDSSNSDEQPEDDGRPRLRDLRGDRAGPVIRRLLTGMYVALDRTVLSRGDGERYWHTQSGGYVRTGPLSLVHNVSTFVGVPIDGTAHHLPFAFMVSNTGWNYRVGATGHSASSHHRIPRLTAVPLTTDPPVTIGSETYHRTEDGFAVNDRNVRVAVLRAPPTGVGANEKWIDIDLDQQVLVAYEGTRPVYVTLVSTGRRSDHDPERNYETPAGSFHIRGKHITTTMDGDTAADGPYSIEDVPWAMYFYESYALHGAFWHGNYGWRMSHGCVNLSPSDARWVFAWSEPQLPSGWHGVFAREDRPGTRLELHHGDRPAPPTPRFQ